MKNVTVISTFLAIAVLGLGSAAVADSPTPRAIPTPLSDPPQGVGYPDMVDKDMGAPPLAVGSSRGRLAKGESTSAPNVVTSLSSMPLAFTENQGQWDERVLYRANAGGATMWFAKDGAYYQFTRRISSSNGETPPQGVGHPDTVDKYSGTPPLAVGSDLFDHEPDSIETMMIKANFVGSNPQATVHGDGLMEYKCNYFLGNDPAKWHTDVPNYSAIVYEDIYPGIDLRYYGNGKQMEYDFIISPGADPSLITVQYKGAISLSVDAAGCLVVETEWGEVIEQRPVVYQISGGDRFSLVGEYVLKGDKSFGFALLDSYDANLPLVIDPTLVYSTYLGGSDYDAGDGIAVDSSGCAYVTGYTLSTDFPTENPYQSDHQGDRDVFVTKLSSSGDGLIYSTYLGGNYGDYGRGIAVDASGAAYVTGYTYSTDFPTENPYESDHQGDHDVFVTKLSSSGSSLVYSTYLGGGYGDRGCGITVDAFGAVYVTGYTYSTDFPTVNPYQTDQSNWDAFVTKLSSSGSSLVYSTYLGGNDIDFGYAIAVDVSRAAYVTGRTLSTDFPTENPYQTDQPYDDAFVTKLSSSGSILLHSTYLGGNDIDYGRGIAVDAYGAAYATGYTYSTDFPTENPYQIDQPYDDAFVTKLSSSGDSLVYSTYLGGNSSESGHGIAVDASGTAYVTGSTMSTNFPTENPYQETFQGGENDVFVTRLNSSGDSLVYSTYLGGDDWDEGWGIAVDVAGTAYVTGYTYSTDFPTTPDAYDTSYNSGRDAFVAKLYESCCNHDGIRGDADYNMTINVADPTYLVDFLFFGGEAPPCFEEGDADGNGSINVADPTYLTDYLFFEGPAPPPCP